MVIILLMLVGVHVTKDLVTKECINVAMEYRHTISVAMVS